MNKIQLLLLIKQYTAMLNDITETLREMTLNGLEFSKEFSEMYALGNDVSQQLDDFKREFEQA